MARALKVAFLSGACAALGASPLLAQEMRQETERRIEIESETEPVDPVFGTETETEVQVEPGMGPEVETEVRTEPPPPVLTPPPEERTFVQEERMYTETEVSPQTYEPYRAERAADPTGVMLFAGGGVKGFIAEETRSLTDTGGAWQARLAVGTRSIIGGEVGYVGSLNNINALGLDPSARLLGNGAEAAARLNFLTGTWQPYALAGAGWTNYRLVNSDFNASSVSESDNVIHFPLGAGFSFRQEGFVVDLRGTVRPTTNNDLIDANEAALHSWNGDLNLGWEF
jgi:hypothetical protein